MSDVVVGLRCLFWCLYCAGLCCFGLTCAYCGYCRFDGLVLFGFAVVVVLGLLFNSVVVYVSFTVGVDIC